MSEIILTGIGTITRDLLVPFDNTVFKLLKRNNKTATGLFRSLFFVVKNSVPGY